MVGWVRESLSGNGVRTQNESLSQGRGRGEERRGSQCALLEEERSEAEKKLLYGEK